MAFPRPHEMPTSPPLLPETNRHFSVFTPPGKNTRSGVFMDVESTLAGDSQLLIHHSVDKSLNTEKEFDLIIKKVNETIKELDQIYRTIGYSETEMNQKKAEIFLVIQDTISSFTLNLQREKNNIQNECDWLRQQIRIILAMLNDSNGEKTLKLSSRGIVFGDDTMYQNGRKQDVFEEVKSFNSNQESFLSNSPFNIANGFSSDDFSMQQQCDYMVKQSPELSLIGLKSLLNSTFLDVLKAFVKPFRKFNNLNLVFWENIDTIGECWPSTADIALISSLPTKSEAEEQAKLLEEFDDVLRSVPGPEKLRGLGLPENFETDSGDKFAFIISSPKKAINRDQALNSTPQSDIQTDDTIMDRLRDVNYKLIRSIRGLKLTKISNEIIQSFQKQIEWTETEINLRIESIKNTISHCLNLCQILSLSDQDLISMQKMHEMNNRENILDLNESYFDADTLRFIQSNPREFGLMDHHIKFVTRLANTLQTLKDTKQKRWDFYSNSCLQLWQKLGERNEYMGQFLEANSSLTDMSLSNLKMELKRLLIKRSEFVETFISAARKNIEELQELLLYSEDQKRAFKYYEYDVNEYAENKDSILNEHEAEVERLKKEKEDKSPILSLYEQLHDLMKDQKFLEESSKDSSRLLSKNSCKILLNEEKVRKKIHKNLPRVIESLKEEVIKFNNKQLSEGNRLMSIKGDDFFEHILLLESQTSNQRPVKPFRGAINRPKPESPRKNRIREPSISPSKRRSPSKVFKESRQPVHSMRSSSGPLLPGVSARSTLERKNKQTNYKRWDASPTLSKSSPKHQLGHHSYGLANLIGSQIQPLHSPLGPASNIITDFDSKSENSTLYSMCSRLSPLKDELMSNSAMQTDFSPIKANRYPGVSSDGEDKENGQINIKQFSLSPVRISSNKNGVTYGNDDSMMSDDNKRLSINSLANSTIIGDEYKQWREEKIRRLNVDG